MNFSKNSLILWIVVAMIVGIVTGALINKSKSDDFAIATENSLSTCKNEQQRSITKAIYSKQEQLSKKETASNFSLLSDIFLRMIKMIIAPLVFSVLVVGVAKVGDFKVVGRIGAKTLIYFTSATLIALSLGLVIVNVFEPGKTMNLVLPDAGAEVGLKTSAQTAKNFVNHIIPQSIIEAMANNEQGLDVLSGYVYLILCFFGGLLFFVFVVLLLICTVLRINFFKLLGLIKEPTLLAFSTASSEAAMPKTIEALEKFGISNKVVSFVLPLGYSFNLDGSIMYMTFATMFIAQAYGIEISTADQIKMMLILLITSKGVAGVPRASFVVIAGMLAMFKIPVEGLLLLLAVDQLLDMGRSATNVIGNAVASAVVAKWEGEKIQ